jgi:hypothetical protein
VADAKGYRRAGWYGYDRIEESGFPVVALEANQYFDFASPNKHDCMAKAYAADLGIHLGPYNWAFPLILAQLFTDLCSCWRCGRICAESKLGPKAGAHSQYELCTRSCYVGGLLRPRSCNRSAGEEGLLQPLLRLGEPG